LADRIDGARAASEQKMKPLEASDPQKKALQAKIDRLVEIKKKIVATKEGGAITGEERIREHLDRVYGALMSWEGKPAGHLVDRIEALRRELADVAKDFDALK